MNKKAIIAQLEKTYLALDQDLMLRSKNIQKIPSIYDRRGGKRSYAEWAHVIGLFQSLIFTHVDTSENITLLDVGCGTGLLAIASEPYVQNGGKYIGIDVSANDICFCKSHYPESHFEFIHTNTNNAHYNKEAQSNFETWPIDDNSINIITALSVWTHFNEKDSKHYLKEVARVLKPESHAIITCFYKDDIYENHHKAYASSASTSKFHGTNPQQWVFDTPVYESEEWFCPDWVSIPEQAIAITPKALDELLDESGLSLCNHYVGNWKEVPGFFFQDVLILKKIAPPLPEK